MKPTRILSITAESRAVHVHRYVRKHGRWSTGLLLIRCGVKREDQVTPARHGFFLARASNPRTCPPFWLKAER